MRKVYLLVVLLLNGVVSGAYLHETATYGGPGTGGNAILPDSFLGARFAVPYDALVTAVGGNVGSVCAWSGPCQAPDLFVAIVPLLDGIHALPSLVPGIPFAEEPVFAQTFTGPYPSSDVSIPVNLRLSAGAYALVFGTGLFGAGTTSLGFMPSTGQRLSDADLIGYWNAYGSGATWQVFDGSYPEAERFWIQGEAVPEPATFVGVTFGLAAFLMGVYRRRVPCPIVR